MEHWHRLPFAMTIRRLMIRPSRRMWPSCSGGNRRWRKKRRSFHNKWRQGPTGHMDVHPTSCVTGIKLLLCNIDDWWWLIIGWYWMRYDYDCHEDDTWHVDLLAFEAGWLGTCWLNSCVDQGSRQLHGTRNIQQHPAAFVGDYPVPRCGGSLEVGGTECCSNHWEANAGRRLRSQQPDRTNMWSPIWYCGILKLSIIVW